MIWLDIHDTNWQNVMTWHILQDLTYMTLRYIDRITWHIWHDLTYDMTWHILHDLIYTTWLDIYDITWHIWHDLTYITWLEIYYMTWHILHDLTCITWLDIYEMVIFQWLLIRWKHSVVSCLWGPNFSVALDTVWYARSLKYELNICLIYQKKTG